MNDTKRNELSKRLAASRRRAVASALLLVAAIALTGVLTSTAVSQQGENPGDTGPDIDATRTALEKWVQTRKQISKEKEQWQLAQEMLSERIRLVQREIKSLRERIDKTETSITEADKKRQELIEQNEKFKQASAALEEKVIALESRTKALLERMPAPLRSEVKPLSQKLPDDPKNTDQSLSKRFQTIIGILNQANKFNSEISLASEVRDLPQGRVNVRVLYVGLGQAFYVNAARPVGGVGTLGDDGWVWRPANDAAPRIGNAIDIYENNKVADFVPLPVEIE